MADDLYLVFSEPPASVPREEYDRWYAEHLRENLQTPGFHAGRRFALDHTVRQDGADQFSHLALYETSGSIAELRAALDRRRESGEIVLPEWFGQIRFSSWHCRGVDGPVSGRPAGD